MYEFWEDFPLIFYTLALYLNLMYQTLETAITHHCTLPIFALHLSLRYKLSIVVAFLFIKIKNYVNFKFKFL